MRGWLAELLATAPAEAVFTAKAAEAMRRYAKLTSHPDVAAFPQGRIERTESGWVLPVSQTALDHVWWRRRA